MLTVRSSAIRRALLVAGLLIGVWALLPPYSGPPLATATRVEVADHVLPGAVLLGVSSAAFLSARLGHRPPTALLVGGFLVLLSGIWMTATHVPLVAQAGRGEVTAAAAAYHTAPGLAVLVLGLVWVGLYWAEAGREDTAPT